jgi:hypothetical protein
VRNLEPYIDLLKASLINDTEERVTSYLAKLEIPYRIVMRDGKTQFSHTSPYLNHRLNLAITGGIATQLFIG